MSKGKQSIWQGQILRQAVLGSFVRLDPRYLWQNPVMLVVEAVSVITTVITLTGHDFWFNLQITLWLWFTVLFANFADALAEGRGKAQAEALRRSRSETFAKRLHPDGSQEIVPALSLRKGDRVLVAPGDLIPGDGEIAEGVALVDESAVTGESAPVIRESGGDRSGVTGGTKLVSGTVTIRITANPGETFLDQMIRMVESAKRQKTPNERALEILLVSITVLFIVVVVTLKAFGIFMGVAISVPVLIALLVCLMPTTIGGLLPAIGISGMARLLEHNVIAMSGRAVEASGDVDVVLLDKTGTITLGNRMADLFIPAEGTSEEELANSALLASLADETPEGRSIVVLAKEQLKIKGRDIRPAEGAVFIPFSAETRMSGIDWEVHRVRKGSSEAISGFVSGLGGQVSEPVTRAVETIAREGGTPLVVADGERTLGVIRLKDILKKGIKERLHQLRLMGIRSVMITGDNPLTAAAISAEAGVDDFISQARPEAKLDIIRKYQGEAHLVAMIGDGTNDAPALAQADVAVAMNAGTQAAREAANMVDLDSNPTKLLDIVEIGKRILITRGALTTFSIANDVAKYFAILPALFAIQYPELGVLNVMRLHSPQSAILAAVIFNALIIPALIPLSLRGVRYRPASAVAILQNNLLIYGLGGILLPFIGIKLLDLLLVLLRIA